MQDIISGFRRVHGLKILALIIGPLTRDEMATRESTAARTFRRRGAGRDELPVPVERRRLGGPSPDRVDEFILRRRRVGPDENDGER
jgi:hypothetical protein